MLNLFESDGFSVVRLTQALNEIKYAPSRLQELGIFEVDNVDVTTIVVEKQGDLLVIVPPTERGAPGNTIGPSPKRDMRPLIVPHFEVNDSVMAEAVQGVRAFGTEGQLETLISKIASRLSIHVNSFAATEEHARMGAVKGVVTYADGSSLDLFSEFGVAQEAEIDFDLDNANPTEGVLRKKCAGIIRQVSTILGGIPFTGLHALCGDDFFDFLLAHKEVRETYKGWSEAQILRESYIGPNRSSYGIFEFGGIVFENYRGANIPSAKGGGMQTFIHTDKCHIFPIGVPGLFKTVYAPADYEETVNTIGRRLYARQYPMQNGKGRHLDSQMNALQYCSRPKLLIQAKRT
ncbi:MAG: hypothetical protein RL299_1918 [Pseudomonadota bacterium]|jgi:hypothetical protein